MGESIEGVLFLQCLESCFQYKFLKTCYWKSIVLGELMLDLSDLSLVGTSEPPQSH